jgi:hypothetical protein
MRPLGPNQLVRAQGLVSSSSSRRALSACPSARNSANFAEFNAVLGKFMRIYDLISLFTHD